MTAPRLSRRHVVGALLPLVLAACGAPDGGDAAAARRVEVAASEYRFAPGELALPPGQVVFAVTNTGSLEHEFELLRDDAVVGEVEHLVPGLTLELRASLEPGTYRYVCRLTGHEEAGMTGTLVVAPS